MRIYNALLLLAVFFLFSCGNKNGNLSKHLNRSALTPQLFTVDINRDTILVTQNGCIIKLPKGTLQSETKNIKLEIKEALSNTDIVLAGLTTMSGNQALSSGGMIYLNAADGYRVEIKKEVEILVPSKTYNPDMKVFKGEEKGDGSIDWQEPTALPKDETQLKIDNGEILFKANCASCHKIDKDFTGPTLAGITDRRPKDWLYAFTRNSAKLIHDGYYSPTGAAPVVDSTSEALVPDFYSACLYSKWNKTMMTSFPNLSDSDLDALYAYIKTEGDKVIAPVPGASTNCCDSCDTFGKAFYAAAREFRNISQVEEKFFNLERTIPLPASDTENIQTTPLNTTTNINTTEIPETVNLTQAKATYYTINIKAFGWYNIDILMNDYSRCEPSELFVRLQGSYEIDLNVVLIIPSVKAFVEGGKLKDDKQYGFDETDGKLPLPQNALCYVMAFGEYKGKLLFGKTAFMSKQTQTIDIVLTESTKGMMEAQIKTLNFDGVSMETENIAPNNIERNSATAAQKSLDFNKKMEDAMKLKPKNCDCQFPAL